MSLVNSIIGTAVTSAAKAIWGLLQGPPQVRAKPVDPRDIRHSQAANAAAHRASRQVDTDMRVHKAREAYEQALDAVQGFEDVVGALEQDVQRDPEDEDGRHRLVEYRQRLESWRKRLEMRKAELDRFAPIAH